MIGTSGALRVIAREPVLDPQRRSWCYAIDPGHWLVGGAINNAGLALSWFHDLLNQVPQFASLGAQLSFDDLIELAGQVPAGAEGLVCLPFLAGERSPYWNMNARAVFFGLALHHNVRHLARALMEGVAFRLCSLKEVLLEIGQPIHQIRASGGFTHSSLWPQIIASTLQRELVVPAWGETSSLGAAFWAMLGTGALSGFEDIHSLVPLGETYAPQPKEAALYAQLFTLYKGLYESLRPAFDELAELRI
jgi:gluconokinase